MGSDLGVASADPHPLMRVPPPGAWFRLFLLQLPFHAAIVALTWRLPEDPEGRETVVPVLMIVSLFTIESLALATGALTVATRDGAARSLGRVLLDAAAMAPRLVVAQLLSVVLVALGLIVLVAPGVILAAWLAFVPLAVALEGGTRGHGRGSGAIDAMRASRERRVRLPELLWINVPVLAPIAIVQNLPPSWGTLAVAALAGAALAAFVVPWAVRRYAA
jgi:hypothetical protein